MSERLWNKNYCKVMLANFTLFFSFYILTPLLPLYLSEHFGATKDVIGLVLSGYTITALLCRPFSGFLVDTFPRKTVLMVCFGGFAMFFAGYLAAASLLMFTVIRTLHGGPFGALTVANSTVAIDVLPSNRRTEGIGYYGLSNNLAMAIAPSIGIALYQLTHSFGFLFWLALIVACAGWMVDATVETVHSSQFTVHSYSLKLIKLKQSQFFGQSPQASKARNTARQTKPSGEQGSEHSSSGEALRRTESVRKAHDTRVKGGGILRFDRFFLVAAWLIAVNMVFFGFCFGVLSNYLAIYGKQVLGMTGGTGVYFMLCSIGLMLSRVQGGKALRRGRLTHNAGEGMVISLVGYTLFVLPSVLPVAWGEGLSEVCYYLSALLIGLGNGHMWPAFQNMTICMAANNRRGTANSTILTAWDAGMGLGILLGGVISEHFGYTAAFWTVALANAAGVALFFLATRGFFLRGKLNPDVF